MGILISRKRWRVCDINTGESNSNYKLLRIGHRCGKEEGIVIEVVAMIIKWAVCRWASEASGQCGYGPIRRLSG